MSLDENLFEEAVMRMRREPAVFSAVGDIAQACGLRRTALNDLFRTHAHESPAAFLWRIRIDHAMRQLAEGAKPVAAAPVFHVHFTARTGLTPAGYAALASSGGFALRLPPRYRKQEALRFFGRDTASVSEFVEGDSISKCIMIDGQTAVVNIRFSRGAAHCTTDTVNTFAAHRIAVRMLGLNSGAESFEREFTSDKLLGNIFRNQRGLRIPMTPEPWEALAWAICGQQISVKAAVALRRELILAAGTPHPSGLRAHPSAVQVSAMSAEQLRIAKFSRSKADYMLAAARAVASGEVPLDRMRELSAVRAARMLKAVRGIGDWTVQYTFLRGLGFTDCLPAGDVGLARGLETVCDGRPDEARIRKVMARFSPWRSYATYHVWSSLKGVGE